MSLVPPARIRLPRPVLVVGWTALAFAGLTVTAGAAHAEDDATTVEPISLVAAQTAPTTAPATSAPAEARELRTGRSETSGTADAPASAQGEDAQSVDAPADGALDTPGDVPADTAPHTAADASADAEADVQQPGTSTAHAEPSDAAPADADADADSAADADAAADASEVADDLEPDLTVSPESDLAEDRTSALPEGTETDKPATDTAATTESASSESAEQADLATDAGELDSSADAEPLDPSADTADVDPSATTAPVGPTDLPAALLAEQDLLAAAATDERATAASATLATATSIAPTSTKVGFKDVHPGMMYAEEIHWMQRQGYTTGWPDGTFRPLEDINRDAFVAMLYRVHAPSGYVAPRTSRFVDVTLENMFFREISWAADQGVTTGWSDGTFRPLDAIDRDAAMAMLQRSFGGGSAAPTRSPFVDISTRTPHYGSMAWGFANGITTGWDDGTFRPQDHIHRDAVAVMLHRLEVLGPDPTRGLASGPTGTHWSSQNGKELVGAPTSHQYRYGSGLRQDFSGGSVLYSPSADAAVTLHGTAKQIYDTRGGASTFGLPTSAQFEVGGSTALEFAGGGIYATDGFTFSVTGAMYDHYQSLGGVRDYLGAPIGDLRTGSTGTRYQSFKGGQLTTPSFMDTPPRSTPAGSGWISYPTLSLWSRGTDVYAVQVKVGASADGVYGPNTRAAVIRYQREQGLPATGVVDQRTWARIMSVPNRIFDGSNGRLAAHQLTIIAPNWTLPDEAAAPFRAMHRAFTAATGLSFRLNDAYRPIDRQILMLMVYDRPRAAYPGTSPHGDVRRGAVDIQVTRGDTTHRWLTANAHRFGFGQTSWQATNEPWHWERR